jgi:ubiquinol-cytochrome c reductase core subunit 2
MDDPHGLRIQNGKQGEIKNLAEANAEAAVESAATGGTH